MAPVKHDAKHLGKGSYAKLYGDAMRRIIILIQETMKRRLDHFVDKHRGFGLGQNGKIRVFPIAQGILFE